MKKTYIENIPMRFIDKRMIESHVVKCPYNTKYIKEECGDCHCKIAYDKSRYIARGNYCAGCNARYSDKPIK